MEKTTEQSLKTDKIWIYQAQNFFTPDLENQLLEEGRKFVDEWVHHKKKVAAEFYILHRLFVILRSFSPVSGCGIDKSTHFIETLEKKYQITLTDRMQVAFIENDQIINTHLHQIPELFLNKKINEDTLFFDNLIEDGSLFPHQLQKPFAQSWLWNFRT